MLKIEDAVDGVLDALRSRGCAESSLRDIKWSVYTPFIRYHHDNGADFCSNELLDNLCKRQEKRYAEGEISRKYYRAFVTAAFRIRSYVETGKVDFSIVKDSKKYKPGKEYQDLIKSVLRESGLSRHQQYKLGITMRQFFCVYEKQHNSIKEITSRDFIDFIPDLAKRNPNSMNCCMRALRHLAQYLNTQNIAEIKMDFGVFVPKPPPHQIIAPFTQEDIIAMLDAIAIHSKIPKRDTAVILLAFNSGLRCVDIRNLQLHNIDWKKQELQIIQRKTGQSISIPLTGKTLNAIAEYILNERPKFADNHVFLRSSPPYGAIKSTTSFDYMVDKYCRLASIEKKAFRSFHSLRRAFGTELAVAEIPVTSISQMLGHKDMSADKAYLSFNRTQTSQCASDFSEVPIRNGIYAFTRLGCIKQDTKDGERL